MLSKLDTAVKMAAEDYEAHANHLYDLFLSSMIYVPTWDLPEKVGFSLSKENQQIHPIIIESEGRKYIMLFDSEERVTEWTANAEEAREIGVIGMSGYDVLKTFQSDVHMMLNVVSDYMKEFVPEEINWLLQNAKKNTN